MGDSVASYSQNNSVLLQEIHLLLITKIIICNYFKFAKLPLMHKNPRRLQTSSNTVPYHSIALVTTKKFASIIYIKITDTIKIKFSCKITKTTYLKCTNFDM